MTYLRYGVLALAFALTGSTISAATPKEIDAAIHSGSNYLKDLYKNAGARQVVGGPNGVGAAALAGLALLECGVSPDDPSLQSITAAMRDAAFTATQTYHISLCMIYLDRLGEPADVPLIQLLAVRLLAGQSENGGWSYDCIESVPAFDERELRTALTNAELAAGRPAPAAGPAGKAPAAGPAGKAPAPGKAVGQLHAEVAKYQGRLASVRVRPRITDNSNTQFGVLGVWIARKHGVPVETALDAIERRFLSTQTAFGGWPYAGMRQGSPSMTCAGLLGLATAIGRREERRMKAEVVRAPAKPVEAAKPVPKPLPKSNDPLFNPPPAPVDPVFDVPKTTPADPPKADPPKADPPKPNPPKPKPPADDRDRAVARGLSALSSALAGNGRGPRFNLAGGATLGDRDLYFMWSVERVGVIFGLEKIGGIDWYEVGAEEIVAAQNVTGSWGRAGRGSDVDTAFALLFLARSNLLKDLSMRVQRGVTNAELRAGGGPGASPAPANPSAAPGGDPTASAAPGAKPSAPVPPKPEDSLPELPDPSAPRRAAGVTVIKPGGDAPADSRKLSLELIGSMGLEWDKALTKVRDGKGSGYTQALVLALARLDGDRQKQAREALADRLARMTAETLRGMAKSEEVELRRAAALAMAMKDDATFLPDLVNAILDDEEIVVRAAKAGLKSLTGQDFGPKPGATSVERKAVAATWKQWLDDHKK